MGAIPGTAMDLLTDGVRSKPLTRPDVVKAVRTFMMSAQRAGEAYPTVHAFLTDTRRRRLAEQLATGRGGRPIDRVTVSKFIENHWNETSKVTSKRLPWNHDDVLNIIEEVAEALEGSELPKRERSVMEAALTLARQHETTRPALPAREIADMTGLSKSEAYRTLMALAQQGDWLSLALRATPNSGRANLYRLAPAVADTYRGASPPESQHPPMSHPPMSRLVVLGDDGVELTRLTAEEWAEIIAKRASESPEPVRGQVDQPGFAKVLALRTPPLVPRFEDARLRAFRGLINNYAFR